MSFHKITAFYNNNNQNKQKKYNLAQESKYWKYFNIFKFPFPLPIG